MQILVGAFHFGQTQRWTTIEHSGNVLQRPLDFSKRTQEPCTYDKRSTPDPHNKNGHRHLSTWKLKCSEVPFRWYLHISTEHNACTMQTQTSVCGKEGDIEVYEGVFKRNRCSAIFRGFFRSDFFCCSSFPEDRM